MREDDLHCILQDGGFRFIQGGVAFGDASPRTPENLEKVAQVADVLGFDEVILVQVAMTHRVALPYETQASVYGLHKTDGLADALVIEQAGHAALIANADCPVGLLRAPDGRAVVMHLGLECIWRADNEGGIMEAALAVLDCAPEDSRLCVGAGIGPCCFGYSATSAKHLAMEAGLRARFGAGCFPGQVHKGPRRGQLAYDLGHMIRQQAELLGIGAVAQHGDCSSCAGLENEEDESVGLFYSHVRDREATRGRNMVLVGRVR